MLTYLTRLSWAESLTIFLIFLGILMTNLLTGRRLSRLFILALVYKISARWLPIWTRRNLFTPSNQVGLFIKKREKRFWAGRLPLHMEHWSDYRANSVEARFGNREQVTLTAGSKKEADKFKTFGKYCETLLTINWVSTQLHYISIVFLPGDRMELKLTLHL